MSNVIQFPERALLKLNAADRKRTMFLVNLLTNNVNRYPPSQRAKLLASGLEYQKSDLKRNAIAVLKERGEPV